MRGYYGIGVECLKNKLNYGTLFRTAMIFETNFIFLIGRRFRKQSSDTSHSWKYMPLYEYADFQDFNQHRPYDCQLVGIEITDNAISIENYKHPERAIYLLGGEDCGLSAGAMNKCNDIVKIPGNYCLNVSVAGSIVLYDRIVKTNK